MVYHCKNHKTMQKLNKRIRKYFTEVAKLQFRLFKTIVEIEKPKTKEDYVALRKMIKLYRENEEELEALIKRCESWLKDYNKEKEKL